MIADASANVVYISDRLQPRFPALVDRMRRILADQELPLGVIRGTQDIWCRDFIPVQVGLGEFVQFRYAPDYLRGYEHLTTQPADLAPIPELGRCRVSGIVLDGGNLVRWTGTCIVTEKVLGENPDIEEDKLLALLRETLRVETLIVIPQEPYDVIGHADGVVRFLDSGAVLVNDYTTISPSYRKRLLTTLRRAGLGWCEMPYVPRAGGQAEIPSAFGNYANFLRIRRLVLLPCYGIAEDEEARRMVEGVMQGSVVENLVCSDLSDEGGMLNCVTWTVASDLPDSRVG